MTKLGKFAAACVAVVFAVGACGSLSGKTCTYDGGWDVAPSTEADDIVIVSGSLTWDASLPAKVASWTQNVQIIPGEDADGNPGTIVWGSVGMMVIVQ